MNTDNDWLLQLQSFDQTSRTSKLKPISNELRERLTSIAETPGSQEIPDCLPNDLEPGQVIAGFRLEEEIGRGGMGVVYRARDLKLGRQVAIKVLSIVADARQLQRFQQEARAAALVRSDHLVPIYSADRATDGRPFLVMPLILGSTLRERLRSGPLEGRDAAVIIREVAVGLSVLHATGLLHRDIKPANVLPDSEEGRAKLTDFGLSRALTAEGITQEGVISGTPEYMAPEQASAPETLDERADVYSLGITLYECLTGTVPFRGAPWDILRQRNEFEPEWLSRFNSRVPKDLETICLKCISRDRSRRYASTQALASDLERWLTGRAIEARRSNWIELSHRWIRRHSLLVVIFATIFVGTIVSALGWRQAARNSRLAEERLEAATRSAHSESLQRSRAEKHLATARSAVDRFYLRVMEEGLLSDPKQATQRQAVLADAAAFYRQMLELEETDQKLRSSAISTAFYLGLILRDLGRGEEAVDTLRRSVELSRTAVVQQPEDEAAKSDLFKSLNTLRTLLWETNRLEESSALDSECQQLSESFLYRSPENLILQRNFAAMQANSAGSALGRRDLVKARTDFKRARSLFEELYRTHPENTVLAADLARTEFNLGIATEDQTESIRLWEHARKMRSDLLKTSPNPNIIRRELVKNCLLLSELRISRGEYNEAQKVSKQAVDLANDHLKAISDIPMQQMRAVSLAILGNCSNHLSEAEAAQKAFREAINEFKVLINMDAPKYLENSTKATLDYYLFLMTHDQVKEANSLLQEGLNAIDTTISSYKLDVTDKLHFPR